MEQNEDIYDIAKIWLDKRQGIINKKHADFIILVKFLQRHPNYNNWINKNVYSFKISRNCQKSLVLYVKFVGKTYRIVSWVACARKKIPNYKQSDAYKLNQAMRYSVRIQMNKFRKTQKHLKCVKCKSCDRIEVDHFPIKFAKIRDNFIEMKSKKNQPCPTDFKYLPKKGRYLFLKGSKQNKYYDSKWKLSWQRFHSSKATFRLLCSKCNKKY